MKILTHNVSALGLNKSRTGLLASKHNELISVMKRSQPDIVLLQQLNYIGNHSLNFSFLRNFSCLKFSSTNRGNGIGFMVNKNSVEIIENKTLQMGHTAVVRVKKKESGKEYYIFNLYSAVGHARVHYEEQFNVIEKYVQDNNLLLNRNLIVAGDINLNLLNHSTHPHHYSRFKSFLNELKLVDAAAKSKFQDLPTWRGFGERAGSKSRIDVVLISKENRDFSFVNYKIHPSTSSDHVILSVALAESRTRVNVSSTNQTIPWKDSIIMSRKFKKEAQESLIELLSKKVLDPTILNLVLLNDDKTSLHKKLQILDNPDNIELQNKDLTYLLPLILTSWKKIHDNIYEEFSLESVKYKHDNFEKQFNSICRKIDFDPGVLGPKEELRKIREERLNDIVTTKAKIKRELRIKNIMALGKATAWSFSSLKLKEERKTLRLFNENTEILDSDEILSTLSKFHANKTSMDKNEWTFKTSRISKLLNHVQTVSILKTTESEDLDEDELLEYLNLTNDCREEDTPIPEAGKLESGLQLLNLGWADIFQQTFPEIGNIQINSTEVGKVISSFKNESSPGPSTENKKLYFLIFAKIPRLFTSICQSLLDNQNFTGDFSYLKKRSIVMIQKNSARKPSPKDFRPISLLELLYKILAKLLLYRVRELLPQIVNNHQFGFVPGRCMSTCSGTLLRVVQEINSSGIKAQILSLDIKAAFDSVFTDSINEIMNYLFPNSNIPGIIDSLTTKGEGFLSIGGKSSDIFSLTKGSGQGDPLSTFRYIILHHFFISILDNFNASFQGPGLKLIDRTTNPPTEFTLPSLCFADDSILFLQISSDIQMDRLQELFFLLSNLTGLEIQPAKTKILLFNSRSLVEKDRLSRIGQVVDSFTHLGLEISKNIEKTTAMTYHKGIENLRKSINSFKTLGHSNLLHRKMLFQSIINSKLTHMYRVLVPPPHLTEEIEKITKSALWTKSFQGQEYGRAKISRKTLEAPLCAGGLDLPPASSLIFRSQVNSAMANLKYLIYYPGAIWNKLSNLQDRGKKIIHIGSKKFPANVTFLKELGPVSGSTIELLSQVMKYRENRADKWNRIPLIGSRFENIFNAITHSELDNFEGLYTLGSIFRFHERKHHEPELRTLPLFDQLPIQVKMKISNLKKSVFKSLKITHASAKNIPTGDAKSLLIEALLFKKGEISRAHKEMIKEKYKDTTMRAYKTRIRDCAEVPRDPQEFNKAISRILRGQRNNEARNFFLEQMLRILPSKNKLYKMNKLRNEGEDHPPPDDAPTDSCIQCNVISDSSHQAAYCVFPKYSIYALNSLPIWKDKLPGIKLNPLILEFHTDLASIQDPSLKLQTDLVLINIKQEGFNLWRDPLFYRITPRRLHVILVKCVKNILELTKGVSKSKQAYWWIEAILDNLIQEEDPLTEFYRIEFDHL